MRKDAHMCIVYRLAPRRQATSDDLIGKKTLRRSVPIVGLKPQVSGNELPAFLCARFGNWVNNLRCSIWTNGAQ
eukprot:scaffold103479_cov19-Prasinocladus_malaysianus.AAC.2